jgi:Fe-Mn family superoxide dismutase
MKTTRRKFIVDSAKATLLTAVGGSLLIESTSACAAPVAATSAVAPLSFTQLTLPYAYGALEPYIDGQTMEIHYSKHHAAYVKNVNEALIAEKITATTEEAFFSTASSLSAKARNNGGGAWNHNFFWQVMKPGSEANLPEGKVVEALTASFGSIEKFKEQFTQAAMTRFGSGWAWLVSDKGKLIIGSTPNQDNPLMDISELKGKPVLALDVWEHAYYLKYQNKRNEYVANWWRVVNWDEVAKRLS